MFSRLRLVNFKAWSDTGDVDLRPITMILGTNSSGKSSLIQSLLLLKQTARSPDRTVHLNFGGDEVNDLFNFGAFDDVINQQASVPRQFSIEFNFDNKGDGRISEGTFSCTYGQTSSGSVTIQSLFLTTGGRQFRAVRREKGAFSIIVDDETTPRVKGRNYVPERSIAFSADAIAALDKDGQLVEDLSLAIRRELEKIIYLGPLRRKPERDYPWNKTKPGDVGSDGRGAIDALLASALLRGDEQNYVVNGVSGWLNRMGVADRIEVRQQGRSNRYELIVHRDGAACNIRDVGIGISQVLPVLVVSYFAPMGSTLIFEEPEIHLHPLAQSSLADLFADVSRERGVQFIVETHSEHLFRRMQTLMAKQKVSASDAAMYFVERSGKETDLRALAIDEFGRVRNWPDGFFGDAIGETREQARLVFERQKSGGA
jgi:predicted ATPase